MEDLRQSRKRQLGQGSGSSALWMMRRASPREKSGVQGNGEQENDKNGSLVLRTLQSLSLGPRKEPVSAVQSDENTAQQKQKQRLKPSRQLVSCLQTQRQSVPCDWTIKSQLEVQTDTNVGWLLRPFPPRASRDVSEANLREQQRLHAMWQQAVKQWVYPDAPLSKQLAGDQGRVLTEFYKSAAINSTFANAAEPESAADTIIQRRIRWLEAVHALTVGVIRKEVPYFFIQTSEWSAVVVAEQGEALQPTVFLVGSVAYFRKRMSALWGKQSSGAAAVQPQGVDGLETVDDTQPPILAPHPAAVAAGLSAEQPLPGIAEEGELGVRAMVDVIAEFVMSKQPAAIRRDVPQLLSPVPFLHASCRSARISSAKIVSSAGMTLHGTIKPRFRIEIQDVVLPTNLAQMLHCLAEATEVSPKAKVPTQVSSDAQGSGAIALQYATNPIPTAASRLAGQQQPQRLSGGGFGAGLNPFQILARQDAATFTPALQQPPTSASGKQTPDGATPTSAPATNAANASSIQLEARCTTVLSSQQLPVLMHAYTTGSDNEHVEETAGMFLTDITYRASDSTTDNPTRKSFELLFAPPTGSL